MTSTIATIYFYILDSYFVEEGNRQFSLKMIHFYKLMNTLHEKIIKILFKISYHNSI